jgi:intracellular multiplication protein IcmJ
VNDTGYRNSAEAIFRSLKFRSQAVEEQFGEGTSEPSVFGQLILNSYTVSQEKMDEIFKDIRLLPSRARFKTQIEHWASLALQELQAGYTTT